MGLKIFLKQSGEKTSSVGDHGIGPCTSSLSVKRSTSELVTLVTN